MGVFDKFKNLGKAAGLTAALGAGTGAAQGVQAQDVDHSPQSKPLTAEQNVCAADLDNRNVEHNGASFDISYTGKASTITMAEQAQMAAQQAPEGDRVYGKTGNQINLEEMSSFQRDQALREFECLVQQSGMSMGDLLSNQAGGATNFENIRMQLSDNNPYAYAQDFEQVRTMKGLADSMNRDEVESSPSINREQRVEQERDSNVKTSQSMELMSLDDF